MASLLVALIEAEMNTHSPGDKQWRRLQKISESLMDFLLRLLFIKQQKSFLLMRMMFVANISQVRATFATEVVADLLKLCVNEPHLMGRLYVITD